MQPLTPTRRGLLGALAVAPVLALPAVPATASATSEWSRAHAAFLAADKAWDDWMAKVYNPALDRLPPMPDLTWTVTAKSGQSVQYRFDSRQPDYWDDMWGPAGERGRQAKSNYLAWKAKHDAVSRDIGMAEIEATDERHCDAVVTARQAAFAAPVGSISEMLEKVVLMGRLTDGDFQQEQVDQIQTDLRRLAGRIGQ